MPDVPVPGSLLVASFNVNGIRAASRRGLGDWLASRQPHVLCVQEVRAADADLALALPGWRWMHAASDQPGRAGVAIALSPDYVAALGFSPPDADGSPLDLACRMGVGTAGETYPTSQADPTWTPNAEFAATGRWIELDLPDRDLTVISAYFPKGDVGTDKQAAKHRFLDAVTTRLDQLASEGRAAIVAGDVNIAHRELDIKNWKANRGRTGFTDAERQWLDAALSGSWVDVVRAQHGDTPGPYSWWSWRGQAFDNDTGWRIDYQFATKPMADRVLAAWVDRAPSYAERLSDHAPVLVRYA